MNPRSILAAILGASALFPLSASAQEATISSDANAPVLVSFTENNGPADRMLVRGGEFGFSAANTQPVVVTDLGANLPVRRVATRYKGPSGRFDFYVLDTTEKLSESRDSAGVRRVSMTSVRSLIDNAAPERRVPVASIRVPKTKSFISVRRFVGPVVGRYVVAIFHRDGEGAGRIAVSDGKAVIGTRVYDGKAVVGSEPGIPGEDVPTIAEFNPGGYNPDLNPPSTITTFNPPPFPGEPPGIFVPPADISIPPPSGIPPISR